MLWTLRAGPLDLSTLQGSAGISLATLRRIRTALRSAGLLVEHRGTISLAAKDLEELLDTYVATHALVSIRPALSAAHAAERAQYQEWVRTRPQAGDGPGHAFAVASAAFDFSALEVVGEPDFRADDGNQTGNIERNTP